MASTALVMLRNSLTYWFSARGFIMVVAAALLPLILTGAWVATHQSDVAAENVVWSPTPAVEGQPLNITADITNKARFQSGSFNATLVVGRPFQSGGRVQLSTVSSNQTVIDSLAPGETRTIRLTWQNPSAGVYVVVATADSGDAVSEIEEFNNQKPEALEVHYATPNATQGPRAPGNLTRSGPGARADVSVNSVSWEPRDVRPNDNVTFTVIVQNRGPDPVVNATLQFKGGQVFSGEVFPSVERTESLTLAPGEERAVTIEWNQVFPSPYWIQAYVNTTGVAFDPDTSNNHLAAPFVVSPRVAADFEFPDPPEKLTIKSFYLDILNFLHIRVLLPLIGLFYAAGVLSDERERGNLAYILTRPVPRWLIPMTKFVASFVVAAAAVVAGILVTFFLLLGTPEGNVGFLTTPLFISLISLFVYGSFFVLLGVLVDRPYLIGLAFVIGWETIAGNFVPWVNNVTLSKHLLDAIAGWRLDAGLQWLPDSGAALDALRNVMIAAIVFLGLATAIMRWREFDV